MTTKVVKGSLWTLAGQIAPLGVSLATTPFVIRMLGADGYGVLILIGLIPNYFLFADFGMSIASTKFGSEAYAAGDLEREGRIVRTSALIALAASLPIAAAMFLFSDAMLTLFKMPEHLRPEAGVALKIASLAFVVNFLCTIFNTPQLTRLRMDLNTFINAGSRIAALIATPIVIYLGFGIIGAAAVLLAAGVINLASHLLISRRLLQNLFGLSIDRAAFRPLLKFGGALVASGLASVLLINAEKGVLAATVSAKALAYYSVAFMLAFMATMLASAMIQSLIPAFSQLQSPEKRPELEELFARSVTLNVVGMVPSLVFLMIIARPFFAWWGGEDFGRESTFPFYILLAGLLINIPSFIPYSVLMALGRSGAIAKLYWAELFPYLMLVFALTHFYGIAGAAAAWSLRVAADGLIFFWLARKESNARLTAFRDQNYSLALAVLLFLPVVAAFFVFDLGIVVVSLVFVICFAAFSIAVWRKILRADERDWLGRRFRASVGR